MRRIVFAPSFDREVEEIGAYVEERFGEAARRKFIDDLLATCSLIASFPGIGINDHGYTTPLAAFVFRVNWIFFDYDAEEVRFLHIVDGRRAKDSMRF
jgi:plasmid stabilization system protein ParE